ncbi:MAG: pseudouridine synthase [Bryobacteraceae bacterium]
MTNDRRRKRTGVNRGGAGRKPANAKRTPSEEPRRRTLDRVISKAGLGSRTQARSWIGAGRVRVNGRVIQTPDHWVGEQDQVTFDERPIEEAEPVYVLLYKPKGYVTTFHDPDGRPTVYDLLSGVKTFLGTVGRLDMDTSGLLLLTNDTQFANRVMSPEGHVEKEYLVRAAGHLPEEQIARLSEGVELDDGPAKAASVAVERTTAKDTVLRLTLEEGRNRQVRRMIEAIGSRVRKLVRIRIGRLTLAGLTPGQYRLLKKAEIQQFTDNAYPHQEPERPVLVSSGNRPVLGGSGSRTRLRNRARQVPSTGSVEGGV